MTTPHRAVSLPALLLGGLLLAPVAGSAHAQLTPDEIREQIGWFDLLDRLGAESMPTGAGIAVLQCEAPEGTNLWGPNTANAVQFAGKTFTSPGASPGTSGHATSVAKLCYGNLDSIAPGVSDIWLYQVSDFLTGGYLRTGQPGTAPSLPPDQAIRIMNHSWIGQFGTSSDLNALNRVDYLINRDNVLVVNGRGSTTTGGARLMSNSFNSITVGTTLGNDLFGDTDPDLDGPGRMKPEMVAPGNASSFTTPVVSATAAVLYETIDTDPVLSSSVISSRQPVMKATLLAGATRGADWTNDPVDGATARPIDDRLGAGVVNVDRSHRIITGYRHPGSTSLANAPTIPLAGFDYPRVSVGQTRWWRFTVGALDELSVALTWPRLPSSNFLSYTLMDLDLELVRLVDGEPEPVDSARFDSGNVLSTSQVDNLELLSVRGLEPGEYALKVTRINTGPTAFAGLAWLMVESAAPGRPADYNGDGLVNGADLSLLLSAWGSNDPLIDLDGSLVIDGADLALLLSDWG